MSDHPWVIDEVDVVHHAWCSLIYCNSTPYGSPARTNEDMMAALARPDVANRHSAPTQLVPCDQCIKGLVLES